jgi:hypothetical protein
MGKGAAAMREGMVLAAKEHMLGGNCLTRMEAMVLFGVSNLTAMIAEMRRDGHLVKHRKVAYAAAMVRINRHASLAPPANLPVRDIMFTEYWISR